MQKEFIAFLILSTVSLFIPFISYNFPSDIARILLITFFFVPILWIIRFSLHQSSSHDRRNLQIAGAFTSLITPMFIFFSKNILRLPTLFEGVEFTETRVVAESYAQQGVINLSLSPHSSFIQTPYLLHALSSIIGLPVSLCVTYLLGFYFIFIGIVGIYVSKVLSSKVKSKFAFLPYLLSFSLVSASSLMQTNLAYRYIGSLILFLLVFFLINRTSNSQSSIIVILFLIVGITLGDPISSIFMIPLFVLNSIFMRYRTGDMPEVGVPLLFLLIPFLYIVYAGWSYVNTWRGYFLNAWSGLRLFYVTLLSGVLPVRVLPWKRMISTSIADNMVASVGYLSLLSLALVICLLSMSLLWTNYKQRKLKFDKEPSFTYAVSIYLFLFLIAISLLYIGSSIMPISSISDMKTILIGYVPVWMLSLFASKTLLSKIGNKRSLLLLVVVLLLFSSVRIFYQTYPKSNLDSVLVVETVQLDKLAVGYSNRFIFLYYSEGSILCDYKTGFAYFYFIVKEPRGFKHLSATTNDFSADIISMDINGLKYPSLFIPLDIYTKVYDASMNGNIVYNNGPIIISRSTYSD